MFLDILEWLGRPQQAVVNLLAGRPISALKHGMQAGFDVVDAILPFDLIPDITTEEDWLEGSEIFGMDDNSHWLPRLAADIGVGVATDPLTYLTLGAGAARGAAAQGAKTAAKGLLKGADKYAAAAIRSADEAGDIASGIDDILRTVPGATKKTARKQVEEIFDQSARSDFHANTVLPAQRKAARLELERGMTKAGRSLPSAERNAMLDDVLGNAGDLSEEALGRSMAKYEDLFTDGGIELGIPFGPKKQFLRGVQVDPITGIKKAYQALPDAVQKPLSDVAVNIAETANWLRPGAFGRSVLDTAAGKSSASDRAANEAIKSAMDTLSSEEGEILFDAFQGVTKTGDEFAPIATAKPLGLVTNEAQIEEITARLAALDLPPEQTAKLLTASRKVIDHSMKQYAEAVEEGLMYAPRMYADAAGVPHQMDDIIEDFLLRNADDLGDLDVDEFIAGEASKAGWDNLGDIVNSTEFNDYLESMGLTATDIDPKTYAPGLYMQRNFSRVDDNGYEALGGLPRFIKERTLKTPEAVAGALNKPGASLVRDPLQALHGRAAQQAQGLNRAAVAKEFLGSDFKLYNAADRSLMADVVKDVATADPAFASYMESINHGMPPRGALMSFLASTNRVFKPAAVYGYVLPKINTNMRNAMSQAFQAMSIPEGRFRSITQLKESAPNVWRSFVDAYHDIAAESLEKIGICLPQDKISSMLREVDDAFTAGGDVVSNLTDPVLQDAVSMGILDNFVTVEDLARATAPRGTKGKLRDFIKGFDEFARRPGDMFQAVESRGRLAMFVDLMEQGYSKEAATQIVKDVFLDYSIVNPKNRALRDIIPFASFMTQTAIQQAKLFNQKPGVASALSHVFGNDTDAVPEWIQGQAHLRLGKDEEGNQLYSTGLGLPPEALDVIPNFSGDIRDMGKDFKRGVVGSSHPLLKTLFTAVSGQDPYFDSPILSYDKTPELLQAAGMPEHSEIGRGYQLLKSTGMIQPLATPITMADQALDDRKAIAARVINMLSGVNMVSVDEARARVKNIEGELELDPSVRSARFFYGDDSELLDEYTEAKREERKKRAESP